MADYENYKIVDAEKLDSALHSLAESIREKIGVEGDLAFPEPNEFKSAVDRIDPVKNETNPTTINTNGYDIPTGGYSHINVKVDPPEGYVDTSGATAGVYDIYYGKTAFVNGSLVTGAYRVVGRSGTEQISSKSTGCSSSRLVISCPFQPTHICIILNSGTHNANTVIAAMFMNGACTYHSRTSSGVIRNQYTTSTSNYFSYDSTNKQVIVNRPNTSYSWSDKEYRYFCFK